MDEGKILVTMRVGNTSCIHPRSTKGKCDVCGHEVWVSPSSHEMKPAKVVCEVCILKEITNGFTIQSLTKSQINEIKEYFDTQSN